MKGLGNDGLREDRQHLVRALHDVEAGKIADVPEVDRHTIRELLILKIAKFDRLLGASAEEE